MQLLEEVVRGVLLNRILMFVFRSNPNCIINAFSYLLIPKSCLSSSSFFLSFPTAFHSIPLCSIFLGIDMFVLTAVVNFTLLPRPGLAATPSRYREREQGPTNPRSRQGSGAVVSAASTRTPTSSSSPKMLGLIGSSEFFRWIAGGLRVSSCRTPFDELLICPSCSAPSPQKSAGTDSSALCAR